MMYPPILTSKGLKPTLAVISKPQTFLLPLPKTTELDTELDLPEIGENLFQRIIRNPHIEATNPRERECTEMFCALLLNTTALRTQILRWFANRVGLHLKNFDQLQFVIDTEGAIGAKRDDLRIEGWRETRKGPERLLLWTVEVKVGASFHESTPLPGVAEIDDSIDFVNQIRNYDHWLNTEIVPHRAGFVLALDDVTDSLPPNLHCQWHCLSWTNLGVQVADVLRNSLLPSEEKFLGKHFLGFLTSHLWRDSEMTEFELNFDEIALLRAFKALGLDCEKKINRLVDPLKSLILECDVGHGDPWLSNTLYKASLRNTVSRYLLDPEKNKHPYVSLGVSEGRMTIWLDTPSGSQSKYSIISAVKDCLPALQERNPDWSMREGHPWIDVELTKPLAILLSTDNQSGAFESFFKTALMDLRESGLVKKLEYNLSQ